MASKRLSFRLQEESEEIATWEKLKKKHPNKKDQQIFNELLRREAIRIDNKETHSDILKVVKEGNERIEGKVDKLIDRVFFTDLGESK